MRNTLVTAATAAAFVIVIVLFGCTQDNPSPTTVENLNVASPAQTASIAGKVLQAGSKAVIRVEQGRAVDSVAIAVSDGYFLLDSLQPGTYRLIIAASGYDTFSTLIKIEPGCSYEFGNIALAERSADFDDSIPSVYDHYPKDMSEVIYLPPDKYNEGSSRLFVSVSFDRPMDRESVEKALSIDPPVGGGYFQWFQNTKTYTYQNQTQQYVWDGKALFENGDMAGAPAMADTVASYVPGAEITTYSIAKSFTFYFPKSGCFTDTTYTIKVARTAVDTAGTPLDTALEFTFKTVQSSVSYGDIQMVPHDGDDWVSPLCLNGIKLTFPRRMNESSVEQHITVNLAADPVFLWTDYNSLTVYTGGVLVPDTMYIITVDSAALDLDGKPLGATKVLTFKTEPIRVKATSPARGALGIAVDAPIILTFNTYMDRTSFAALSALVSGDGDTVAGAFNNNFSCRTYTCVDTTFVLNQILFRPYRRLKNNTLYRFHVGPGAKDLNGYTMKTDYEIAFVTMP